MTRPTTVAEVLARMHALERDLDADDGVAIFNRVYLDVTERIAELLELGDGPGATFLDPGFLADLDVRFARRWLEAYDEGEDCSPAWAPLMEGRRRRCLPIQFALAGMNAHIEHDLPLAVVETCEARGISLRAPSVRADYDAVNDVLATVESDIRRSFLDDLGRAVDDEIGPVVHLVSSWNIEKAREIAWVNAETMWSLRRTTLLRRAHLEALAHTVGMGSRILLTPLG